MVIVDWIGLGQSASGVGWIGFSKMDPCPTLGYSPIEINAHRSLTTCIMPSIHTDVRIL